MVMVLHTSDGNLGAISYPAKTHQIQSPGSKLLWDGMSPDPPGKVCFMSILLFPKEFPPKQNNPA